jgi:hypothetical protein
VTRAERLAAVFAAALLAGLILVFTTGALAWLNGRLEFSAGANIIQWISGPATFAAVVTVIYSYLARRCAVPFCLRHGEHPVDGTLQKVCTHHHTQAHHARVHELHGPAHAASGRLSWGESHLHRKGAP